MQNIIKIMHYCIILVLYTFYVLLSDLITQSTQMIFDYISDKDKELYEKRSRDTLKGILPIILNGDCIQEMIIRGKLGKLYNEEVLGNLSVLSA